MQSHSQLLPRAAKAGLLAGLCLCAGLLSTARANSVYSYTVNTSALTGQSGFLAFDLLDGDGVFGDNTVIASSLTTDGSLADSSNVSLTDAGFFNEEQRAITFGSTLHFSLNLTTNYSGSGFPDEFSFFLLDGAGMFSLVTTADPSGALLAVDIDGSAGGAPYKFESTDAPGRLAVPETASTIGLLLGSLGLIGLARRRG